MLGMCRFADDAAGEDDDGDDDGGGSSGGDCGDDGDAEGVGVSYDLSDPFIDDSLGLPAAEPCAGYDNYPATACTAFSKSVLRFGKSVLRLASLYCVL
jgi:hypothetical protein